MKLCARGYAAAKKKFKVYPSAYANAYASKVCSGKVKGLDGKRKRDWSPRKSRGSKKRGSRRSPKRRGSRRSPKKRGSRRSAKRRSPKRRGSRRSPKRRGSRRGSKVKKSLKCWPGYVRVPGKRPGTKGSCRKR